MKKLYLILLSVFALLNTAMAQELKVKSFSLAINDLTASTDTVPDKNGDPCALVKILVVDSIAKLEGFVLKTKKSSPTELWAYMSDGAKEIRIKPTHYKPLYVYFPNFGINGVEGKRTYILDLEAEKLSGNQPTDAGGNFYAISVLPKTAMLWIDGVPQETSSDGEYSAMLAYGSHTYKVEAGGYISKSGSFTIGKGDMTPISVSLVSALATLSVSCPTPAVSLYVDKKSVGFLPWNGNLKEGMHLLEVRKDGYRSQQKTIQLAQQQKLDVAFDALSAIQGNLSVNFKPFGSDVYVDGVKVGQSPRVFNGVLVGNHNVEIRKPGYATSRQTVTISEGQTASISGSLTSSTSSSSANTLSSSGSSLSGNALTISVKNGINIEMVKVEAGSFNMGALYDEDDIVQKYLGHSGDDEAHRVILTKNYFIGKYEVTQALWKVVMGGKTYGDNNEPKGFVSWKDCQKFISKLNILTGKQFRLPTEAEWEYAARGGKKSCGYKYSGGNSLYEVAWSKGNSGSYRVVGTRKPNELGIYDMSGNVSEWCYDWYGSYSSLPQANPTGADSGSYRVMRGGSFAYGEAQCEPSTRSYKDPNSRNYSFGFRLVLAE